MQRRSILELLTSKLIDDGILYGTATIKVKGGGTKTVSWSEKLKYLLARKTEPVTEKYPLISNGMVAAFLVAVLTPIFTFIAYAVKPTPTTLSLIHISEQADSLAARNAELNRQLQELICQIEEKVQAELQSRENEIVAMREKSFMQVGGLMGFVLLLLLISYICLLYTSRCV